MENILHLGEPFTNALKYATDLHAAQVRKGTAGIGGEGTPAIPYVAHLLAVTAIVLEHGGTQTQAIAALLHDAVEDHGGLPRLAEIEARFGAEVAHIVEACTDGDRQVETSWRDRKIAYVRHLPGESAEVLLVSASDKRHNAQAILDDLRAAKQHADAEAATVAEHSLWARFKPGRGATLRYYEALSDAYLSAPATLTHPGLNRLVAEFAHVVAELSAEAGGND
ncbi:MAG: HD domain-containing protein, partial [Armatimonadetes bacterium]|nr:HD domain-containing protein [Armatimonadota bacterium]